MAQKNSINKKRLTKKEVSEIIETEGKLHEEYTKFFEEKYVNFIRRDRVYELPGKQYLYVFDEKGFWLAGKGDIFTHEYFIKYIKQRQRTRDDFANKRVSSVTHWRFYSKYSHNFIDNIGELIIGLSSNLEVAPAKLDFSYESLDIISKECMQHEIEELFDKFYDGLVAYVGEVIKKRINGSWEVNSTHSGGEYPFISINSKRIQYMPINVVWDALNGIDDIDLRKLTANEVRRNSSAAKFERDFPTKNK